MDPDSAFYMRQVHFRTFGNKTANTYVSNLPVNNCVRTMWWYQSSKTAKKHLGNLRWGKNSCWVLLVRCALFCIIRHNLSESPDERFPPLTSRRMRPYAVVHQRGCVTSVLSVSQYAY